MYSSSNNIEMEWYDGPCTGVSLDESKPSSSPGITEDVTHTDKDTSRDRDTSRDLGDLDSLQQSVAGEREPEVLKRTHRLIGIGIMVIVSISLTLLGVVFKQISMTSTEFMPYMGMLSVMILTIPILKLGRPTFGKLSDFLFVLARSVVHVIYLLFYVYALKNMPISEAVVIISSSAAIIVVVAWIGLKERPGAVEIAAAFTMIGGVILIARPSFIFGELGIVNDDTYPNRTFGEIVCVIGAVFYAVSTVLTRKIGLLKTHWLLAPYMSVVVMTILGLATAAIFDGGLTLPICDGRERYYLLATAVLYIFNGVLITMAYKFESAAVITAVRNLEIVLAFLAQYYILQETEYSIFSFIGAGVIFSASVVLTLKVGLFKPDNLWCRYC